MGRADKSQRSGQVKVIGIFHVRPPKVLVNVNERTARRSVPATFVGCVSMAICLKSGATALRKALHTVPLGLGCGAPPKLLRHFSISGLSAARLFFLRDRVWRDQPSPGRSSNQNPLDL